MNTYTRPLLVFAGFLALVPTSFVIWLLISFEPQVEADLRPAAWHPTRVGHADDSGPESLAELSTFVLDQTREAVARHEPPTASDTRPRAAVPWTPRRVQAERLVRDQTRARARRLTAAAGIKGGEEALASVLLEQRSRFEGLHARLSRLPSHERRQALKVSNRELRAWYDGELASHFGVDAVARIHKPFADPDAARADR